MFRSVIISFLLFVSLFSHAQQRAVPEHGGVWVHDEANVLSPSTIAQLEAILKVERDSTSNQIAVLIVPSLEGDDIDTYGIRVADSWKVGQADKDNGAILIVALKERKVRIEVGQGLEGVLTDAMSSRINRNEIAPRFRQGDYDGGVRAGVSAIIQTIKGQYVNTEPPQRKRSGRSPWLTVLFIVVLLIVMSRRRGGGIGGYWAAGTLLGGGFRGGSDSYGSGSDYGGGGSFGGGGSSDSW